MKKLAKRTISIFILLALVISLTPSVFALENDPDRELRAEIYRQLEAQDALYMYDVFVEMLITDVQGNSDVSAYSNGSYSWNAPNGGVLHYKQDWTYRDESGYTEHISSYLDESKTDKFFAGKFGTLEAVIIGILGFVPDYGFYIAGLGVASLFNDYVLKTQVDAAGGYIRIATVYDSISGKTSQVAAAWDTYSKVTLNNSKAYEVVFKSA